MSKNLRINNKQFVDETRKLSFIFNGKKLYGYKGDTLASALLSNDIHLVGRSFKYHRPRGIMTSGSEEPNAILQIGNDNALTEPNVRATEIELYDGLICNIFYHLSFLQVFIIKHLCGQQVFGRSTNTLFVNLLA